MEFNTVILVTGDRNYNDYNAIYDALKEYKESNTLLIHGGCKGADLLADRAGKDLGFIIDSNPADWKKYGRAAGPIRNKEMVMKVIKYKQFGKAVHVFAFHDNLSASRGTKNCVDIASKLGLEVTLYSHE